MALNIYSVGLQNVGSYQVSGQPYLSGSVTSAVIGSVSDSVFSLPYVSKRLIIRNLDSTNDAIVSFAPFLDSEAATYGFTNSASGSGNWLFLPADTSIELDIKCKQVFISPAQAVAVDSVSIYAELTNIGTNRLYSFDGLQGVS